MRTQLIRHIDTGVAKTGRSVLTTGEIDDMVSHSIQQIQEQLGDDWYLISVAPLHRGIFVTTWEWDTEMIEEEAKEENAAKEDPTYHKVHFGDRIDVNGVLFKLTHFGQSFDESMVTFTPLSEIEEYDPVMEEMKSYGPARPSLRRVQYRPGTFGRN